MPLPTGTEAHNDVRAEGNGRGVQRPRKRLKLHYYFSTHAYCARWQGSLEDEK